MTLIFFFSSNGYAPMKDIQLRLLCRGSHGWQPDGETWVYGACEVEKGIHPQDVADRLSALGVVVLPGLQDQTTPVDQSVAAALARWISPADRTLVIAKKMAAASGHPQLRPTMF